MKKISVYRPTTIEEAQQNIVDTWNRRRLCGWNGPADPLEEQAEASTDLSRRHQKDQQSAIHQRGCSRWRPDWRLNKIGRDRRVGSVGEKISDAGSGRENDFFTGAA